MRLPNTWRSWAIALTLVTATVLSSCQKNNTYGRRTANAPGKRSATTGADFSFNADDSTQFFVAKKAEQIPGPNLKLIQGGRAIHFHLLDGRNRNDQQRLQGIFIRDEKESIRGFLEKIRAF